MNRLMRAIRWAIVWLYVIAGVLHIVLPAPFLSIMPNWVPWPGQVIFITGLCEIVGAIGLLIPKFRKTAGFALAFYAIAVFPANINHALQDLGGTRAGLGPWYHLPRLAFQPILVWAALFAGELICWPKKNRAIDHKK